MPGNHVVLSDQLLDGVDSKLADLRLDVSFAVNIVHQNDHSLLVTSSYGGYPVEHWHHSNGAMILVEGMIYNYKLNELKDLLDDIAGRFERRDRYEDLIRSFVDHADGEFIVLVLSSDHRLLAFNDYFGRLPYYYYTSQGLCVFSREVKFILNFIPEIKFNKIGLAEFLMSEHTLSDDTLFSGVRWMMPAQIMTVDNAPFIHLKKKMSSVPFECTLRSEFKTRQESIQVLRDGFHESVENRVNYLESEGYSIIADLSGGFDSRTVLAGLQKFSKNVTYYSINLSTNYSDQDETEWAEGTFRSFDSPGTLVKLHNSYNLLPQETGSLVYNTDCMVNYESTYICYQDVNAMKLQESGRVVRMPGLGGSDFIRKCPQYFSRSIAHGIKVGLYSRSSLHPDRVCQLVALPLDVYFEHVDEYQRSYRERSPGDQLKRFYFDYQFHFAQGAPEDRERHHFWTSPPMCGMPFMRTILSRFPNHWSSQSYYVDFMKAVDPRLLDTPLYGNRLNLKSKPEVWMRGFYPRLQSLQHKVAVVFPDVARAGKKLFFRTVTPSSIDMDLLRDLYSQLDQTREIVHLDEIIRYLELTPDRNLWLRISTLYLYFKELENRFSGKIRS
jgi:hypothetical protein